MNIENRLKLFRTEKTKILGFGRSHLRNVDLARRLETDVEKRVRKAKKEFTTKQAFLFYLWDNVRDRGDELLRRERFQFRVFDEGTVEFLDQNFIKRPGNGFATRYEDVASELTMLPEKVRAVLQLHYQSGLSCKTIAKKIHVPEDEVYQLWQHSLIYLWEALQKGDNEGFHEQDDEAFWTLALKYLDGTASEKFVAQLNSEIHVSKTRTQQYNDLRMIDGIMIGFGNLNLWPDCPLVDEVNEIPAKKLLRKAASKNDPERYKISEGSKSSVFLLGFVASVLAAPGILLNKLRGTPKKKDEVEKIEPEPPTPVLATEALDQSRRHGVHIDEKQRKPRLKISPAIVKKLGILAFIGAGATLLALVVRELDLVPDLTSDGHPRVLRSSGVMFAEGTDWNGERLAKGTHFMEKGTIQFYTSGSIGVTVEAPAQFTIKSDHELIIGQGRFVVTVPSTAPDGLTIQTERFRFSTSEGEIGVVADDKSIELLVFSGDGILHDPDREVWPGAGLRFFDVGEPETFVARDEAHRFPDSIPVVTPKTYGDNLIANSGFEIGLLSRSCKTERQYRDIPLSWKAGWQKDGVWSEALEQHSGTVRITDAIGGLPTPVEGERYLWVNHGFVAQELAFLEPGSRYELSVQIASHRNLGPGAGHLVKHIGGNMFRFGIWSGSEWIAETSGQLEAGQPFQEMKMKFKFPETGLPGMVPVLMLTGETRIFYDSIVLKKL